MRNGLTDVGLLKNFVSLRKMCNDMAVDMTYNFRQDAEPTDDQLEQLMREVGEDVRARAAKADEAFWENVRKERELAKEWTKARQNEA
jgi:hypothetical protein